MLLSTVSFGVSPSLVQLLHGDVGYVDVITYRGLAGGLVLLAVAALQRHPLDAKIHDDPSWRSRNAGLLIGIFFFGPEILAFYLSFQYLDTSLAVALAYIYPTIVLFIVAARSRRLPAGTELLLSLVALTGVLLLMDPGGDTHIETIGLVLIFVAGTMYAIYVVAVGDVLGRQSALRVGGQVAIGSGLAIGAYGLVSGSLNLLTTWEEWAIAGLHATLMVFALAFYYMGLSRLGAGRASLIDTAAPLVAVLAGAAILGERMVFVQFVGVGLVMLSVAATTLRAQRRPIPPTD